MRIWTPEFWSLSMGRLVGLAREYGMWTRRFRRTKVKSDIPALNLGSRLGAALI